MKKILYKSSLVLTSLLMLASCEAIKNSNNTQRGTAIGAGSGAVIGGVIGNNVGDGNNSVLGAIIGAAVGGAVGNRIGNKMDRNAEAIEEAIPGAEVTRIGEGINVTFDENSGVKFALNSADISAEGQETLGKMAEVFVEYDETNILIEGHTDSSGSDAYNMTLSEKRAKSVRDFLASHGVASSRMTTKWYGETQPKYDNNTEEGRVKNRRVELGIVASDEMIQEAKSE
ncbi:MULTISPECIES: OmpA family protein [Galbibacter]|uniref:OmpA family protein n=1 Tax=Galbibacter pacificus TaxID=2996052 RepID=A0ABT6FQU6_9FLAO|nr:OmpA family protein [Galbibacter pacificus]MDG3581891.1 OmpA family protein [Galbibacter pacificus]MDG3585635.1 OmpA family protein [Galbibacter pacificus]